MRFLLRLAIVAAVLSTLFVAVRPRQPLNVILVISDSLRAANLDVYGYSRVTAPTLAHTPALVFTRAYSHFTFTWPSVASLFTGLPYSSLIEGELFTTPSKDELFDWTGGLEPDNATLAERLSEVGVRSLAVSASPYIARNTGFGQGFEYFHDWDRFREEEAHTDVPYVPAGRVNRVVASLLDDLRAPDRQPWFLYLHYMDTHMPYRAEERDLSYYRVPGYDRTGHCAGGAMIAPDGEWLKWKTADVANWVEDADVAQLTAHYDAQIRRFDRELGSLLGELKAAGLRDRTIVIVTSDHGESLFERGFWGHGYMSRAEEQHVPLLVIFPPELGISGEADFPITTTDIFHAIVRHFRADPSSSTPLPPVANPLTRESFRAVAYTEGPGGTRVYRDDRFALYEHTALEKTTHQLPRSNGLYLFDLEADAAETVNLLDGDDPSTAEHRRRLLATAPTTRPPTEDPMMSAKGRLRESLRALGYVE